MNFGNDQKIESVNQSTIVQAKGDININGITANIVLNKFRRQRNVQRHRASQKSH
jgi:hypothetical protein